MNSTEELTFMLIDIDYKINVNDNAPTIRLFGKTKTENILIHISDFLPYFYITKKKGLESFIENNKLVKNWLQKQEACKKKRYFGGEELNLIQLFGSHPEQTPAIRAEFQNAGFEVHEADIPFVKRFLIDLNIRCLNIIKVKPLSYIKKGKDVFITTLSGDINPISKEIISSADYFYKLKIMAFDIEVDHETETIQQLTTETKKRITAISYVFGTNQESNNTKIFILQDDNDEEERIIIQKFIEKVNDIQPDILITFNGDNFDLPYLLARMEKLKINNGLLSQFQNDELFYSSRYRAFRIKGRVSLDISPRTWQIHPVSGKKGLGDISETILGEGKIEVNRTLGDIWRSGYLNGNKNDQKLFESYAIKDSKLTYQLFWKLGINGWLEVVRLTGYPAGESPGSTERIQGEFELMRFLHIKNVLIPLAPDDSEVNHRTIERRKNPHTGGTVLVPKGTLHIGVIISDFRSMYPSVCVAHNIGGEVLKKLKEVEKVNPLEMFHAKPQSCLSLMEETLIKRREQTNEQIKEINTKISLSKEKKIIMKLLEKKEILDKEQYSLKIVANSMYGAHNYIRSRFYSITLGNAITNIARTYILRMEELMTVVSKKIAPVEIIYGDTDSAFIKIKDDSFVINIYNEKNLKKKKENLEKLLLLSKRIMKTLNDQFPEAMELTLEDIAYKLIFKPGRSKAYSYYSLLNDRLQITGFEAVRSDWSYLSREAQTKVLEFILKEPVLKIAKENQNNKFIEDPGLSKAKEYLIELSEQILKMPAKELIPKVMILSPIKRNPKNYKTKIPVVQAFLDFAKREGLDPDIAWKDFDKFQWIITPGKGILSSRARHPKYVEDVDREHYITEILRSSEGFGIKLTLQDIKNKLTMEPIDEILKRMPKIEEEKSINNNKEKSKKITRTKQMKLSKFFEEENSNK
ncbi:MAG: hypothetical protein EAX90_07765 [Candidatus Heimdallarchaeota archaeon]|nr:hypothetical protein [Candidatus Heimdallarchaeota archaeon]